MRAEVSHWRELQSDGAAHVALCTKATRLKLSLYVLRADVALTRHLRPPRFARVSAGSQVACGRRPLTLGAPRGSWVVSGQPDAAAYP
jgi:hypothetical protein